MLSCNATTTPARRAATGVVMAKVFFIVRSTVSDAGKRAAFDRWYRDEHLPDAIRVFGAEKGWRFWSETDPAVHQAMYRFADRAACERATAPANFKPLIDEFDRVFPNVKRSREVLTLAEER